LSLLFSESLMELLLLVAQHGGQAPLRREMPTLLEIVAHTLRDVTPEQLMEAKQPPPPPVQKRKPEQQTQEVRAEPPRQTQSQQQPAAAGKPSGTARPSPAAFHPTGKLSAPQQPPSGRFPPPGAPSSSQPRRPGPPALDSAVAAQLKRQQLAAAAKLRSAPSRPGGFVGRFVVAHSEDPNAEQRRTFLTKPGAASAAATTVRQHIVEAPPKLDKGSKGPSTAP
ncbi:hypothetical protein Agub_g13282, partial [Astrephomene gubernaculifera]